MVLGVGVVVAFALCLGVARPAGIGVEKARSAAAIFAAECADCHGKDGRAKTFKAKFNGAKDLTKPEWQENTSDSHIFNVISNGHGKMPAYGKKLTEAEIDSLVTFIRGLRSK